MTIDELLFELGSRGVQLRRSGRELVVLGKRSKLDAPLIDGLRAHKTTLLDMAGIDTDQWWSPSPKITPEMLTLAQLSAEEIERVVSGVPGGAANIQDIYPLAPLQEGILFHHLMGGEGDPYVLGGLMSFDSRARLDAYLQAMQAVIDRHDIMRTAVMWEGLPEPVQVVWRKAPLVVEEVELEAGGGDLAEQLYARFNPRRYRIDVRQAPLLRVYIAHDPANHRCLLMRLNHHLTIDHSTQDVMQEEIEAHLLGKANALPTPLPFRNLVAQARLGVSREEHEAYFRRLLGDVEEPTAPFGLLNVRGDGSGIEEAWQRVEPSLARRVRGRARKLGVSAASICHAAWAVVLARLSGREDVVFGTVLFGRMQGGEGADRVMGLFINTLPVRMRVGSEGAEESVRRMQAQLSELLRHEQASLMLAQRCSAVPAPAPLFSALLNYRHSAGVGQAPAPEKRRVREGIRWLRGEERTNYPVTLSVDDLGEGFGLKAQVEAPIEPMRICEYMHTALTSLAHALETEPGRQIRCLDVLPERERRQVLYEWNATEVEYPREKCVHELFEEQVEKTPDAVAIVFENDFLSYAELNARANRLAHHLRGLGVGPDARVAICLERSVEMVVGLLGALKAGGAYVPLDSSYPPERLAYMLEDSAPTVILTHAHTPAEIRSMFARAIEGVPVIDLEADAGRWANEFDTNPDWMSVGLTPHHLAYVIYTSGSTGLPKGVGSTTSGFCNRLTWFIQSILEGVPVTAFKTSIGFLDSLTEVMQTLLAGGRVVVFNRMTVGDPNLFADRIKQYQVANLVVVPSLLGHLLEVEASNFRSLKTLICSGERLGSEMISRFKRAYPQVRLLNFYGSSEVNGDSTAFEFSEQMDELASDCSIIGRPIANTRIYLLDRNGESVPIGVPGEMSIGGEGLARGYLNRAAPTAERFLPDPFGGEPGARIYKTGDLGRWLPDGAIEFLGRNDYQVKIRGFRIELGEIEARLLEHEAVREAVVIAREDTPGDKRLVAYYTTSEQGEGNVGPEALRTHLSAKLPEYMAPAAYVRLESLPLTPSGKLDRQALPAPEGDAYSRRGYEAPQGETETLLAAMWAELLKLERVGRHDNFFELGGHSLLAIQVMARLRQALDIDVSIGELFAHPSVAGLSQSLEGAARAALPAVGPMERPEKLPLSFAQQRLWFLAQMPGGSQAYHIPMGLRLRGELDVSALRGALDGVLERHEALRTTFVVVDGQPAQRIAPAEESRFLLLEYDLRGRRDAGGELERLMAEEAREPFDLEAGPVIRGRLIRDGEEEYALLITMHHIASDGWSMGIFFRELSALYGGFVRGERAALPKLGAQYADYALWQRKWMEGGALQRQAEYWKSALAGAPALLELPTDHPRPAQQDHAGAFLGVELDEGLTAVMKALSRRHGTTLFMTLLAGWAALLARLSGQEDVVIGTPVANRNQVEIEGLIGFFINTLAQRVDVSGAPTVGGLLERVKRQVIAAQQNQDIPFEQVVELVRPARSLSHSPVFQVVFTWQNAPRGTIDLRGVQVSRLPIAQYGVSKFDLTLSLWEAGDKIVGWLEYATALFERATVERYLGYFRRLLQAMASDDTQEVGRLDILPEEERRQALYEWNATEAEYPRGKCVHELFEEQMEKAPEEVAVVCEGRRLTYGELNGRANQLARRLQSLGVEAGERVAILLRHSPEAVISLLGALKAGCAYVPLDPFTPKARAAFILKDSRAAALLTQEDLLEGLPERPARVVCVDGDWGEIGRQEAGELERRAEAESPAYVLYTSGSTGEPKGVEVRHRALVNYVWWAREVYLRGERLAFPFYTSLAFDLTLTSIFAPLLSGGRIIVYPTEARGTPLERIVEENQVEVVKLTPSHLGLIKDRDNRESRIKRLIVGGEALETALARQVYESFGGVEIYNEYGPTEATVGCMVHRYDPDVDRRAFVPIGGPGGNTRIYVLDGRMEPVAENVVGEIYIAGDCLAEGYLNREGMTGEAFIDNPFDGGRKMYRSGDLGRRLPEGVLEYVGRRDEQVKYHGHRVELGEIRSLLNRHPQIRDSVVRVKKDGQGLDVLVAYYVSRKELGAKEIREYLLENMAEETLPSVYAHLKKMPLTLNGKVDYQALPSLEEARGRIRGSEEGPRTPVEEMVAAIWAELLKLERVGRHDNFFELGGHSLVVHRVVNLLAQRGIKILVTDLFEYPTPKLLGDQIESYGDLTTFDRAICIRKGGPESPLFLAHEGTGNIFYARALSQYLDPAIPVYGLPAQSEDEPQLQTIEALAMRMVRMIRTIRPGGPYRIAGWSFGGHIAYEIAVQLIGAGEEVEFLGLLDTFYPSLNWKAEFGPAAFDDKKMFLRMIEPRGHGFLEPGRAEEQRLAFTELTSKSAGMEFDSLLAEAQRMSLLPQEWTYLTATQLRQILFRYHVYELAILRYSAQWIPIPIHLFLAEENRAAEPFLGWSECLPEDQIRAIPTPGTHHTMMTRPHIEVLGQVLSTAIRNASNEVNKGSVL